MGFFQEPFNWSAEEAFSPDNWGETFSSDNVFGSLTGGGVDDVKAPTPSTIEEKLMQQQLQALNNGQAFNEALMPYMMDALGYKYGKVTNPDGTSSFNITKKTWEEKIQGLSPQEQKQIAYQDWQMSQTMISQGINPETFKEFASQEEQFAAMTPQMQTQKLVTEAINNKELISKGINPNTGKPFTSENERLSVMSIQDRKYETINNAVIRQDMITKGINPDTMRAFTSEKERYSFLTAEQKNQSIARNADIRRDIVGKGINPDTGQPFTSREDQLAAMNVLDRQQQIRSDALSRQDMVLRGLNPKTGEALTEEERLAYMTTPQKEEYALAKQYRDLKKKALSGDIPISPGLERDIATQEGITKEGLARQLGSDFATTTPGIQTLFKFNESANIARDESRRGWLAMVDSLGSGLSANMAGGASAATAGYLSSLGMMQPSQSYSGLTSPGQGALWQSTPSEYAGNIGLTTNLNAANMAGGYNFPNLLTGSPNNPYYQSAQGYGSAMQPYQFYSGLKNEANMQNAVNQAGITAAQYGLLGNLIGAGGMYYGLKK